MGETETALRLLAQVLEHGPSEHEVALFAHEPALSAAWQNLKDRSVDDRAALHQRLFGRELFLMQSVFLSHDAIAGGDEHHHILELARSHGLEPHEPADSLSSQLRLLADLPQDQRSPLLLEHLLTWLPAATVAVIEEREPFYSAVAELCLGVALIEASKHAGTRQLEVRRPPIDESEPSSLRDLAEHLSSPNRSGVFLSQRQIAELGHVLELPRGFGGRARALENLFRAASDFDRWPALLEALDALLARWHDRLSALRAESDVSGPFQPWQRRIEATRAFLSSAAHNVARSDLMSQQSPANDAVG